MAALRLLALDGASLMATLKFQDYTSVSGIAESWDSLLPEEHPLLSRKLLILEKSNLLNTTFRYFILKNESNESVGLLYLQLLQFTHQNYRFPVSGNLLFQWLEKKVMSRGFPMAVCGNLLRINAPGIFFLPQKTSLKESLMALRMALSSLKPLPSAILLKDWPKEYSALQLQALGFQPWQSDTTMQLPIDPDWRTMDDYVISLRHRYSQRYRRIREAGLGLTRREFTLGEIEENEDALLTLYKNVVQRQEVKMIIVGKGYFPEMKRSLGEKFKLIAYSLNGKVVAFSTLIDHPSSLEQHYIGLNYESNAKYSHYFNLLYDGVRQAIEIGAKNLELGRTARVTKTKLGAQPEEFDNYVKLNNRFIGWVVSKITMLYNNNNKLHTDPVRVFKEKARHKAKQQAG